MHTAQPMNRSSSGEDMSQAPPGTPSESSVSERFQVNELFPCPPLDEYMHQTLVHLAHDAASELVLAAGIDMNQDMHDDAASPWASSQRSLDMDWYAIDSVNGVQILRGREQLELHRSMDTVASRARSIPCLRASSLVDASLEEVAMLFKHDSHKSVFDHGLLFDSDLEQTATLYALQQPSGSQPRQFVGVRWCLVQSPWRFARDRDFCFVECQKEFRDRHGHRGWVRSLSSIRLPACGSLEVSHGIVRGNLHRCGLVARENGQPGVLHVTYIVEADLKGTISEFVQTNFFLHRMGALGLLNKVLQQQRLSSCPLLGDLDLLSRAAKTSCHYCYRSFGLFCKRLHCRSCGEAVCRHCSDDWNLSIPAIGKRKVRICTVCSAQARNCHTGISPPLRLPAQACMSSCTEEVSTDYGSQLSDSVLSSVRKVELRGSHEPTCLKRSPRRTEASAGLESHRSIFLSSDEPAAKGRSGIAFRCSEPFQRFSQDGRFQGSSKRWRKIPPLFKAKSDNSLQKAGRKAHVNAVEQSDLVRDDGRAHQTEVMEPNHGQSRRQFTYTDAVRFARDAHDAARCHRSFPASGSSGCQSSGDLYEYGEENGEWVATQRVGRSCDMEQEVLRSWLKEVERSDTPDTTSSTDDVCEPPPVLQSSKRKYNPYAILRKVHSAPGA